LAANIRHGLSSLTHPSLFAPSSDHLAKNEQLRQQVLQANENPKATNERDDEENKIKIQCLRIKQN